MSEQNYPGITRSFPWLVSLVSYAYLAISCLNILILAQFGLVCLTRIYAAEPEVPDKHA